MSQTPASPTPRSALSELVELLGKFLGLTAAGLIVLSTAYDFSFLHALGLSFEEVPSSMADHVRSAIVWAPRAAIYVLAFLVYEFAMRVTEGGLTEEEILLRSHNPRLLRAFRRGPSILFGIVVVTLIAGDFLLTSQSFGLYLGATVAWGVASTAAVAHPRVAGGMSAAARRCTVIIPILVIWVGTMGYSRGNTLLTEKTTDWTVELKADPAPSKLKVLGLRQYQSHTILVLEGRAIQIVPNDRIASTMKARDKAQDLPRLCRWGGMACPASAPKP